MKRQSYEFVISRSSTSDAYQLWRVDPSKPELLTPVAIDPGAKLDRKNQLIHIGDYLLEWGPLVTTTGTNPTSTYPYRLLTFDPTSPTPICDKPVQSGSWEKAKFFSGRVDFGHQGNDTGNFSGGKDLCLIPCANFVLNFIPTAGRGTFKLLNFDPGQADPLPYYPPQGAFSKIELGHELIYIGGYVLDWCPATRAYALWSFDPLSKLPLSQPTVQQGVWKNIDKSHQLLRLGDNILDWVPATGSYRLLAFDPKQKNPISKVLKTGRLPRAFNKRTTLLGVEPPVPVDATQANTPGTLDFMRSKIKHVVYLMIENRSFDHICGWLYENDKPAHIIGPKGPFKGASKKMFNTDGRKKVFLSKFRGGKIDESQQLEVFTEDPYHDNSDVMRQLFHGNPGGYRKGDKPDMGGFVFNNGNENVMQTFTPEQIPVLNGLAKHFAISDEWFCSMPGGTDVNRAFALTGSSFNMLNNFQNGAEYTDWPDNLHRPSIFKALWTNGITNWRIYNSVQWMNFVFTYHLFLQGQVPTIDADVAAHPNQPTQHLAPIEQFLAEAKAGTLPAFCYLEPRWIAPQGTTSYHPGGDLVPGEQHLLEIFEALQSGPAWEETLLVITFDEHGGIYDHVPPPYAEKPYPNDCADGFNFDLMGVRIPTVLVSPLIQEKTVFRSETGVAYDATSILATLLDWFGVPPSHWGLGDRIKQAPTFEGVLLESVARQKPVKITPPYDKDNPRSGVSNGDIPLNGLHQAMAPHLISTLTAKLPAAQTKKITDDIMGKSATLKQLHGNLVALEKKMKKQS
ncbi:MAG TPA: alkaline phosphatase family protein [Prosthecobacter sp.]|nr:alkaline phosphatase family protein [Prosthecobacter sp.]